MSAWTRAAIAAEAGLLALLAALAMGVAGRSRGAAAAMGAVLVLSLGVPSLFLLLWGRARTGTKLLAALFGTMLGKLVVVGAALAYVMLRTRLPQLPFAGGLLGGWILSFAAQAAVLRAGARRARIEAR